MNRDVLSTAGWRWRSWLSIGLLWHSLVDKVVGTLVTARWGGSTSSSYDRHWNCRGDYLLSVPYHPNCGVGVVKAPHQQLNMGGSLSLLLSLCWHGWDWGHSFIFCIWMMSTSYCLKVFCLARLSFCAVLANDSRLLLSVSVGVSGLLASLAPSVGCISHKENPRTNHHVISQVSSFLVSLSSVPLSVFLCFLLYLCFIYLFYIQDPEFLAVLTGMKRIKYICSIFPEVELLSSIFESALQFLRKAWWDFIGIALDQYILLGRINPTPIRKKKILIFFFQPKKKEIPTEIGVPICIISWNKQFQSPAHQFHHSRSSGLVRVPCQI